MSDSTYDPKSPNEIAGRIISMLQTHRRPMTLTEMRACWQYEDTKTAKMVLKRMQEEGLIVVEKVESPGRGRKKRIVSMAMWRSGK